MKHYLFGIVLLIILLPASAQIKITELSYLDGLKEEHISNIVQDHRGCIWMATFGGLCSYDGYRRVCYKATAGDNSPLVSNRIQSIACNADNDIWCISNDKLSLFNTRTHQFRSVELQTNEESQKPADVTTLFPLKKSVTWVLDQEGNAYRLDDESINKVVFPTKPDQQTTTVKKIIEDEQGNEWIITSGQLFIYGKSKSQLSRPVDYCSTSRKGVWFAGQAGNLYFYSYASGEFRTFTLPASTGKTCQLLTASDDFLYIATEKGIWTCTAQGNLLQAVDLSGHPAALKSISEDKEKCVWGIFSNGTVIRHNPANGQILKMSLKEATGPDQTDFSHVLVIENNYDEIWFSLRQRGDIVYWDRSTNTIRQPDKPYQTKDIRGRFIDNQKNVWIRKSRGIDKISFYGIQHHWEISTEGYEVRCMLKDTEGAIWLADKGGYLRKFDKNRRPQGYLNANGQLTSHRQSFGTMIYSMLQDRKGMYWLGSRDRGLFCWNPVNGELRNYRHLPAEPYSLSDDAIFSLAQDQQGRIWIGTLRGGLNLADTTRGDIRFFHAENGLFEKKASPPRCVRSILEIKEQHLMLLATMSGLYVFSTRFTHPQNIPLYQNVRRPADANSISNNEVLYLMRNSQNDVYATTNSGGINRLLSRKLLSDTLRFQSYTEKDGAYSDLVLSIVEDRRGKLWTISERILSCFDPVQGTFLNYGSQYLRPNLVFSEAAPLRLDNGMLVFGTEDGLLTFHPEEVRRISFTPPIVFTRLLIQGKDSGESIDTATELVLNPGQRTITIGFAALDYNQTQPIRYRYRLTGLNEHWMEIDESRSAAYINLPPGNYRFEVESTNSDGTWVANRRSLPIHVAPTFWETGWAWLIYVLTAIVLLLLSLYLYRRFYSLKLRIQAEQEITDAKLRFFTDISHELRTPLTLIDAPVNHILEKDGSLSTETRTHLKMVQRNTGRMLQLVSQILDFRKMQNQKMKLLLQETDVNELLTYLSEYFLPLSGQHHIPLILECPVEIPSLWIDHDKFEKIFFNLISNAFKYTPDGKEIVILLSLQDEWVTISVRDEGIGIPEDQIGLLFKRFETVLRSNLFKASSGIGLALVKQFTDLHQAKLNVESKQGAGSTFSVSFSRDKNVYAHCPYAEFLEHDTQNDLLLSSESDPASTISDHTVKILIVEDNKELRMFLHNILQSQYQVFEAEDGEKGLEAARLYWPDLILSDVMMPRMDGFEMVRRLKSDEAVCHIPIVLLTAKTLVADQIEGIRLGADDYILKPFHAAYLLTRIAALIEGRQQLQKYYLNSTSGSTGSMPSVESKRESTLSGLNQSDEHFAQRIIRFLEQHLDEPDLSVEQLATEMNMGRTVFFNKIKSIMGCSPVEFIQSVRIRNAVRLFDEGDNVISDVAYRTGFSDPKYFSRCFKKQTGVTPSDYIKQKN